MSPTKKKRMKEKKVLLVEKCYKYNFHIVRKSNLCDFIDTLFSIKKLIVYFKEEATIKVR